MLEEVIKTNGIVAMIQILNGYWCLNGVPMQYLSFPEQQIVSTFIKNQIFVK
jgi:hypothetical protein